MEDREIEEQRRLGEGWLAELLLLRPNRFSAERSAQDALVLGALSLVCLLPLGPLAVIHAVRNCDQRREARLPLSAMAIIGGGLGVLGTGVLILVLVVVFLR